MRELIDLKEIVKKIEERLTDIEREKEKKEKELAVKGYTLKKINGYTYIYRWYKDERTGKTKWKSLGNIIKNEGIIERIEDSKTKKMLKELQELDKQQEQIRDTINKLINTYIDLTINSKMEVEK